jgi:predicted MFS family arabinose efflux permease
MLRTNRSLFYVVLARFISRLGGAAVWFIGVWGVAAYGFGATPRTLAAMSAMNGLAAIVGSLSAGVLIDRFGPRKVMIWAEVLRIPPVLAMVFAPTFPLFVVCSAIFSLFGIPTWTAGASFAPYLFTERDKLERANAYIEGGSSVGFVLGPAIGAVVSNAFGMRSVFFVMVAASVLAAIAAWRTQIDETPHEHAKGDAWGDFRAGLRISYTTRSLRYFILTGTAVWFGFGAFSALEPLFYRDVVGVGVEWIGWMNTAFGLGLIAGAWTLPRMGERLLNARSMAVFTVLTGLGTVLYVGSTQLWRIAIGGLVWGFFIGAFEPLMRTLMHLDSPHEFVGRIVGTAQWHRSAGELIPLAFVPALAAVIGIQETLIAGGMLVALVALVGFPEARAIDRARGSALFVAEAEVEAEAEAEGLVERI